MSSNIRIFTLLLLFRIFNSFLVSTFFSPDEYMQSLEVAHRFVFGYGDLTWEWQRDNAIRSFFHPFACYVPWFSLVRFARLDERTSRLLLVNGVKLINGVLAGIHDIFALKLARLLDHAALQSSLFIVNDEEEDGGDSQRGHARAAHWILFCTLTSWFHFYALPRSFSNSIEAVTTIVALFYYFKGGNKGGGWSVFVPLMALGCLFRPTNGVIWIFPVAYGLLTSRSVSGLTAKLLVLLTWMVVAVAVMLAVDRVFYGSLTFTLSNFLEFNVFRSLSSFYGTHPWHWYLSQGIPVITTVFLPLIGSGVWQCCWSSSSIPEYRWLFYFIASAVAVFSVQGHKEFRFIHALLTPMLYFASVALASIRQGSSRRKVQVLIAICLVNVPMALYMTTVHQRGVIDLMTELGEGRFGDHGFLLMPCHSTPMAAYHHRKELLLYALTCEPPLHLEDARDIKKYKDESDLFYADPEAFITENFDDEGSVQKYHWPQFFVMFQDLLDQQQNGSLDEELLLAKGYEKCHEIFNSHFHDDKRRRGNILIYCRKQ